ncbi:hypothetical protein [Sinorhizobium meliloti]|uniref:hypothetical protein n=1 Tax=Rhizobium meliloti TaxID=382 RepID=UPI0004223EA0|nr:hypothetical protein [Sinorhizobium meliloti]UDU18825.1 hypothetical protein LJD24_14070 [Sinorhizobium meliloti]
MRQEATHYLLPSEEASQKPIGYRSILDLAHLCRQAVVRGDFDDAKRISDLISQLEERFPAAKKALGEDFPGAK